MDKPPLIYNPDVELEEIDIFNLISDYELLNDEDDEVDNSALKVEENIDFIGKAKQLKEKQESFGYKKIWVYYTNQEKILDRQIEVPSYQEMVKLAELLGYKTGWAFYKFREIQQ